MTEELSKARTEDPEKTAKSRMAKVREQFMPRCGCSPEEFGPAVCCGSSEFAAPEENAAAGGES